jgi:hypothetical protein
MRQTLPAGCCAPAVSGQAAADPAIPAIKSRRRIASPKRRDRQPQLQFGRSNQEFALSEMGFNGLLRGSNSMRRMSEEGQKHALPQRRIEVRIAPNSGLALPHLTLDASRSTIAPDASLFAARQFPVLLKKFPVPPRREFQNKSLNTLEYWLLK